MVNEQEISKSKEENNTDEEIIGTMVATNPIKVPEEKKENSSKKKEEPLEAEKDIINDEPTGEEKPLTEREKIEEDEDIDVIKASDIVRDYFFKLYLPWIFLFQIESVKKNKADNVYIVNCSFFPAQGGYEKNYYTVKVNVRTGKITDLKGFSFNVRTKVKKLLEVEPPSE